MLFLLQDSAQTAYFTTPNFSKEANLKLYSRNLITRMKLKIWLSKTLNFFNCFNFFSRYGQKTPPSYDLSLIKEKVRLWHGTGDLLADVEDVEMLEAELRNADVKRRILDKWGHITFMMGKFNRHPYLDLVQELKDEFGI